MVGPNDPQVLYKLGLSFYAAGQYKKCVSTLKTALMNKPFLSYEADIYYHIGLAYCNVEKYEKSIYPFQKVSFNDPNSESLILVLWDDPIWD